MKASSILYCTLRNLRHRKLILLAIFIIILWYCFKEMSSTHEDLVYNPYKTTALKWEEREAPEGQRGASQETNVFPSSPLIGSLSKNIKIHCNIIKNGIADKDINGMYYHSGVITLQNTGQEPILLKNMIIYFSSMRKLWTRYSKHLNLSHVNGILHKIEPISGVPEIAPGQIMRLEYLGSSSVASRRLMMPNWYFVTQDGEVGLIENTLGEQLSYVRDFTTPQQWKRFPYDKYNPYTPETRYEIIGFDTPKEKENTIFIIPQPMYVFDANKEKQMRIDGSWGINAQKGLEKEAEILKAFFHIEKEIASVDSPKRIVLKTGDPGLPADGSSDEAYALTVDTEAQNIQVIGQSLAAVFYGIQTLLSLADEKGTVSKVSIKDAPRFEYRGMHLDVSRNFQPKSSIFRLLEAMAMYKLNKFHFHLTDDEAWRLEIPGLPELTTIGSKSCHDPSGLKCLQPQLGADPRGTTSPTYYTVEDYREILQFAKDRHIEVIPEIDMPGHCYAAIKSMEARYHILLQKGKKKEAEEFILTEFSDETEYMSVQNYKGNTLNPCIDSTYRFMSHVIEALVRMHKDIQPLKTYHLGGDEVPRKVWMKSPACEKQMPGMEYEEKRQKIKEYFVERTTKLVESESLTVAGWDDFFTEVKLHETEVAPPGESPKVDIRIVHSLANKKKTDKATLAYSWNNIWKSGVEKAYLLAQDGYKIVLAHATHLYFDHPQEPDPEEHGNFWATRFSDTRKVFGYIPSFCYDGDFCEKSERTHNILGITGALWSETVRTAEQFDHLIFPRLLALAERAWHKSPWEDIQDPEEQERQKTEEWMKFSSFIVQHELKRLEKMGIKYRVPLPGARFDGHRLKVRTALPGLPVQFSKDGGKTWHDVTKDTEFDSDVILVTRSLDRLRMSRPVNLRPSSTL